MTTTTKDTPLEEVILKIIDTNMEHNLKLMYNVMMTFRELHYKTKWLKKMTEDWRKQ